MRQSDRLYLLRLWQDADSEDAWRARLEDLHSREVRHFSSLDALTRHLLRSNAPASNAEPSPRQPGGRRVS
jgi:hypothetical protein